MLRPRRFLADSGVRLALVTDTNLGGDQVSKQHYRPFSMPKYAFPGILKP